jgi:hypothetical protein
MKRYRAAAAAHGAAGAAGRALAEFDQTRGAAQHNVRLATILRRPMAIAAALPRTWRVMALPHRAGMLLGRETLT